MNKTKLWALKTPDGEVLWFTVAPTKGDAWNYEVVAEREGKEWAAKYWRRWDASIASAKRLGWKFVRVKVVEV